MKRSILILSVFVLLVGSTFSATAGEKSASSARNGQLHMTKECSEWQGLAGQHCTVTGSDLQQIAIGSKIFYDQGAGIPAGLLDSNVVLDAGNGSRAVGRCTLDLSNGVGLCTYSDGTGSLVGFQARLDVTCGPDNVCALDGTYRFAPQPER